MIARTLGAGDHILFGMASVPKVGLGRLAIDIADPTHHQPAAVVEVDIDVALIRCARVAHADDGGGSGFAGAGLDVAEIRRGVEQVPERPQLVGRNGAVEAVHHGHQILLGVHITHQPTLAAVDGHRRLVLISQVDECRVIDHERPRLNRSVAVAFDEVPALAAGICPGGLDFGGRKRRSTGDEGGEQRAGEGQDLGNFGHVCVTSLQHDFYYHYYSTV